MRKFVVSVALAAVAAPLFASEQVVLRNGFRIAAERHESGAGGTVKLYTSTGMIELAQEKIERYETEEPAPARMQPDSPAVLAASAAPVAPALADPKKLLDQAAERYGIPAALLHGVARVESAYRVNAISAKGAIGVMQLMPATAAELGANPYIASENIDAGARHLRDLLERYDGSAHKALSAYNAGSAAVQRYGGIPPYAETLNYVHKVINTYHLLSAKSK